MQKPRSAAALVVLVLVLAPLFTPAPAAAYTIPVIDIVNWVETALIVLQQAYEIYQRYAQIANEIRMIAQGDLSLEKLLHYYWDTQGRYWVSQWITEKLNELGNNGYPAIAYTAGFMASRELGLVYTGRAFAPNGGDWPKIIRIGTREFTFHDPGEYIYFQRSLPQTLRETAVNVSGGWNSDVESTYSHLARLDNMVESAEGHEQVMEAQAHYLSTLTGTLLAVRQQQIMEMNLQIAKDSQEAAERSQADETWRAETEEIRRQLNSRYFGGPVPAYHHSPAAVDYLPRWGN